MANPLSFVLRVIGGDGKRPAGFLGTGLLLAPEWVLTCRHVVLERDPMGRPTEMPIADLWVETDAGEQRRAKAPRLDPAWDLALLELESPLRAAAPPLLWGITRALEAKLRQAPLLVAGYAQVEPQGPLWQHPVAQLFRLASYRQDSEILTQLQLAGGLPAGCSGAPALLPLGEHWAYAGTLYLGGERAAASRLIMADPVAEFLATAGLPGLARLDATRAFALVPAEPRALELLIERPAHPLELPNPYRGLAAFRALDAPYFHGRAAETQALYQALQAHPLVSLIGASGSGKSSLLFAGVVPRLRAAGHWQIASFRPKGEPFGELASALIPLLYPEQDKLERRKRRNQLAGDLASGALGPSDLLAVLHEERPEARVLLIADQLEELYTQNLPRERQHQFLAGLAELVQSQENTPACTLLLSLRADFLGRLLGASPLGVLFKQNPKEFLGPLDAAGLQAAIAGPAAQLGVTLEAGLTERILEDLGGEPGNLPLLEFALTELWKRQARATLTHDAYAALGGVNQALARHADAVLARYRDCAPVRRILVQLVRPGEGTEDTRQIATQAQIGASNWALVKALADARLVVTGRDEDTEQETVELVHEALIGHWAPLREWIDQDRAIRTWQNRLRQAVKDWEDSGKEPDALLRGARLAEAEERLAAHRESLSGAEKDYIAASLAERERQRRERQHLQVRISIGLAAFLVIALLLSALAARQWVLAEKRGIALAESLDETTRSKMVAEERLSQAEHNLGLVFVEKSKPMLEQRKHNAAYLFTLYALANLRSDDSCREALVNLPRANVRFPIAARLGSQSYASGFEVTYSPDGKTLASRSDDGKIHLWDVASGVLRMTVTGHTLMIDSLAFAPDGKTLASGSRDQTIRLWNVASGALITTLTGHTDSIWSVSFSPDGKILASGSGYLDRSIRLWDVATGTLRATLAGHTDTVSSVRFHPDGKTLASGSHDRSIRLWGVISGAPRTTFTEHTGHVNSLSFAPDGEILASGSGDGKIRLWDVDNGALRATLMGHAHRVYDLAFHPDGKTLASGSQDGSIRLWDVATGTPRITLTGHMGEIMSLSFHPDGKTLASGSLDRRIRLWDVTSGALRTNLTGHTDAITSIGVSPDGKTLATGSHDRSIRLWDIVTGALRFTLTGHRDSIRSLAFAPDGETLASGSLKGDIRLWDVATGTLRTTVAGPTNSFVNSLSFSPDGLTLAAGTSDHLIWLFDVVAGTPLSTLTGHTYNVASVSFAADGKNLASGSWDQSIGLWDIASGTLQTTLTGHADSVASVRFAPDGKKLASGSWDQSVRLWDVASGTLRTTLTGHTDSVSGLCFTPDGKTLASGSRDRSIRLWDVDSGALRTTLTGHADSVSSLCFTPDGKTLISGSHDESIRFWDVASGSRRATLTGHKSVVFGLAFAPDGKTLASASDDKTTRLWDVATGTLRTILDGHESSVLSVAFAPDGETLASASIDSSIRLWDVHTGALRAILSGHGSSVLSLAFAPDGKTLASGSRHEGIRLWDIPSGEVRATLGGQKDRVESLSFSPDGRTLASASFQSILLWDVTTGALRTTLTGHAHLVKSVDFAPDGNTLASGSWDQSIRLWDVATGALVTTLSGNMSPIESVGFAPDGKILASGFLNGDIGLWEVASGAMRATLSGHTSGPVETLSFSPDGKYLASGSRDKIIRLWDVGKLASVFSRGDIEYLISQAEKNYQLALQGIDLKPLEPKHNLYGGEPEPPRWSSHHPFHWLPAAERGNTDAMVQLGIIYHRDRDWDRAESWYRKAAEAGSEYAKQRLIVLEQTRKVAEAGN